MKKAVVDSSRQSDPKRIMLFILIIVFAVVLGRYSYLSE